MAQLLFTHISYQNNIPTLHFFDSQQTAQTIQPRGRTLTLSFDKSQRLCTGWHDLRSGETFACPHGAVVESPYHECRHCQQKTGFNPAFYHAASVSEQQQERNQQPHFLYLAHFAPGVVKVGISYAKRDIARLLDQGARSFVKLKTFPTANSARSYEAEIAKLPGVIETLQGRVKYQLFNQPYNPDAAAIELQKNKDEIARQTGLEIDANAPLHLDHYYLAQPLQTGKLINLQNEHKISGLCIGTIGDVIIVEQNDLQFFLPLSKLRGFRAHISDLEEKNTHAPQQTSLF